MSQFKGPGEWLAQVKKLHGGKPQVVTKKAEHDERAAKVSKDSVHYRSAEGIKHCGSCVMFRPETGSCTLVAGDIEADHVCDRWAPKSQRSLTPLARRKRAHA